MTDQVETTSSTPRFSADEISWTDSKAKVKGGFKISVDKIKRFLPGQMSLVASWMGSRG